MTLLLLLLLLLALLLHSIIHPITSFPYDIDLVAAGSQKTCFIVRIAEDGDERLLKCVGQDGIGYNTTLPLGGDSSSIGNNLPFLPLTNVTSVSVGGDFHGCAVAGQSEVWCWSPFINAFSVVGDNTTLARPTPVQVWGNLKARKVVTVGSQSFAIGLDSSLWAWGQNSFGVLGIGTSVSAAMIPTLVKFDSLGPTNGGNKTVDVAASLQATCAIVAPSYQIICWGSNYVSQCGFLPHYDPTNYYSPQSVPAYVSLGTNRTALQISAGSFTTCAIDDLARVRCWGSSSAGGDGNEAGDGNYVNVVPTVVALPLGSVATQISCMMNYCCAVLSDYTLWCWGNKESGAGGLGDGTTATHASPVLIPNLAADVKMVSAGYSHTCVILRSSNQVKCVGSGTGVFAEEGVSYALEYRYTTARVASFDESISVSGISLGPMKTTAMIEFGKVKAFGDGNAGLGLPSSVVDNSATLGDSASEMGVYLPFLALTNITYVSNRGIYHGCCIAGLADVYCWSPRGFESLDAVPSYTPRLLLSNLKATAVETSFYSQFTCIVAINSSLFCFGPPNSDGNDAEPSNLTGVDLGPGNTTYKLSMGSGFTCVIVSPSRRVKCFENGEETSFLGYPHLEEVADSPFLDLGLGRTALEISCGFVHCGVVDDLGRVIMWGSNEYGEMGIDTTGELSPPVPSILPSGRTAVSVRCGFYTTCILLDNGAMACTGRNDYSQLGLDASSSPLSVTLPTVLDALGTDVATMDLGDFHGCAVRKSTKALYCWGRGGGQLGNGAVVEKLVFSSSQAAVDLGSPYAPLDTSDTPCASGVHYSAGQCSPAPVLSFETLTPEKDFRYVRGTKTPKVLSYILNVDPVAANYSAIYLTTDDFIDSSDLVAVSTDAGFLETEIPVGPFSPFFPIRLDVTVNASRWNDDVDATLLERKVTLKAWLRNDYTSKLDANIPASIFLPLSISLEAVPVVYTPSAFEYTALDAGKDYDDSTSSLSPIPVLFISNPSDGSDLYYEIRSGGACVTTGGEITDNNNNNNTNTDWFDLSPTNGTIVVSQGLPDPISFRLLFANHSTPSVIGYSHVRAPLLTACVSITFHLLSASNLAPATRTVPVQVRVLQSCPPGTSSSSGKNEEGCDFPCLFGMNCTLRNGILIEDISLLPGFWRAARDSDQIIKCPRPKYCKGGVFLDSSLSLTVEGETRRRRRRRLDNDSTTTGSDALCRDNHTGILCYACEGDLVKRGPDRLCTACTADDYASDQTRITGIMFGMVFVFLALVAWVAVRAWMRRRRGSGSLVFLLETETGKILTAVHFAVKLKIIIGLLQVVGAMTITFGSVFPAGFQQLAALFAIFSFDLINTFDFGCTLRFQNHYASLLLATLVPMLMGAILLAAHAVLVRCWVPRRYDVATSFRVNKEVTIVRTTLILLICFLVYPSTSNTILKTFSCEQFASGVWTLRSDYSVVCYDSLYYSYLGYAIFMTFVYPIGIPVLFGVYLWHARDALLRVRNRHRPFSVMKEEEDDDVSLNHLEFLINSYKPEYYYWEIVELIRKLLQTSVIVFITEGTASQMVFLIVVTLIIAVAINTLLPYRLRANNALALLGQWSIVGISFVTLTIQNGQDYAVATGKSNVDEGALNVLLILLILLVPVAAFGQAGMEIFEAWERHHRRGGGGTLLSSKVQEERDERALPNVATWRENPEIVRLVKGRNVVERRFDDLESEVYLLRTRLGGV